MGKKQYVDPTSARVSTLPVTAGFLISFCLYYFAKLNFCVSAIPVCAGAMASAGMLLSRRNSTMANYRITQECILKEGFFGKILEKINWKDVAQIGLIKGKYLYISTKERNKEEILDKTLQLAGEGTFIVEADIELIAAGKRYVSKEKWII